ncbi:RNA polymerase sigma factor [Paraburkholderia humisilvae]|uniref:RNA polymerase sigma factor n=1 Tax=Paraburkholderia humisilvae TaxID=627669 RepID=UPI0015843F91
MKYTKHIERLWVIALSLSPDNEVAESLLHTSLDCCVEPNGTIGCRHDEFVRRMTSIMVSAVLSDPRRFDTTSNGSPNSSKPSCNEDCALSLQIFLRQLPRLERVVLTLRELAGWDVGDIAALMGSSTQMVLRRQVSARLAIGRWLMDKGRLDPV